MTGNPQSPANRARPATDEPETERLSAPSKRRRSSDGAKSKEKARPAVDAQRRIEELFSGLDSELEELKAGPTESQPLKTAPLFPAEEEQPAAEELLAAEELATAIEPAGVEEPPAVIEQPVEDAPRATGVPQTAPGLPAGPAAMEAPAAPPPDQQAATDQWGAEKQPQDQPPGPLLHEEAAFGVQALEEQESLLPASGPLTPLAWESLPRGKPLAMDAAPDQPAMLAYSKSLGGTGGLGKSAGQAAPSTPSLLLEIVDDDPRRRWSEDELLLIEQVTDQLSLALENAQLFEQTQRARDALQVSVRYQKSVAEAVTILTERGFSAVSEVLQTLGKAAQASRAYYLETQVDHRGPYWRLVSEWHAPKLGSQMANPAMRRLSAGWLRPWIARLERDGFRTEGIGRASSDVKEFLESLGAQSILQFPVAGQHELPGCIGFEQVDYDRVWTSDEIAALQTAASALANTIVRENLFNQLQVNLSETEAQYQASAQLNSANEAGEILAILRQFTILGHMNASYVSISLFDHPWGRASRPEWLISAARWSSDDRAGAAWPSERRADAEWAAAQAPADNFPDPLGERYPLTEWKNAENLLSPDRPAIVFDLASDSRLDKTARQLFAEEMGARSMLTVPLNVSGRWIGQIIALYRQTTGFTEREIRRLVSLSGQAAVAVESLRLLEETRQRNEELLAMNQVTSAVSRTLELDQVLEEILQRLLSVTEYDSGLISYVVPGTRRLTLAVEHNLPAAMAQRLREGSLDGTPCDLVFRTNHSVHAPSMEDLPEDVYQLAELLDESWPHDGVAACFDGPRSMGLRSYLGVPLVAKGEPIGTVCVFSTTPKAVSSRHILLAEAIGRQVGIAVDNARLFHSTQIALGETETLYQASSELNAVQNYEDILYSLRQHTILGKADKLLSLALFNHAWFIRSGKRQTGQLPSPIELKEPEWVIPIALWSTLPPERQPGRYELRRFPAIRLLSHSEPTIVEDVASDPRLDDASRKLFVETFEARSLIFTPLFVGSRWIGFVFSAFGAPTRVEEAQIRRLTALAGQAAISIQNLRLLDESRRRASQLQTAAEIARDTSSTLALDSLLKRTVSLITERFGYDHASVFLVDEESNEAVVRESTGPAGEEMKRAGHRLVPGGRSVIGQVIASGKALVLNDVSAAEARQIHRPNPLLPLTRAELGIPLKIGDRVIGAFDVQSNMADSFTDDDVAVLQTLADQIAVAVDNARSYALAQKAVDEIREADRLKTQFLANMSHELRTPLNSIIGFSRVILKGIDGPINGQQNQDLTAIYNSGQHLLGLINDVLDLSRIEAGKMDVAYEKNVNLAEIIRSVMSTMAGLVKDKPIELKQMVDPELPLITADSMKIRQVLINLLSNAAKFTAQGSITVQAMRRTGERGEPQVMVRVIDTGPGIAKKDQEKLFQPFSQVDGSLTRKTGGSGLGLSICSHLIQMHHGEIGLESEIGKGSAFYFILPVEQAEEAGAETDGGAPAVENRVKALKKAAATGSLTSQAGSLASTREDTRPIRPKGSDPKTALRQMQNAGSLVQAEGEAQKKPRLVLAIDPDPKVIDLYKRYLANVGCAVISLTRLDQAVTVARELQPFAITLDVGMRGDSQRDPETPRGSEPPLDGMKVLQKLKTDQGTGKIPVIVCSMLAQQEKAFELGAVDYLLKPILEEDLIQAIQRLQAKDAHRSDQ